MVSLHDVTQNLPFALQKEQRPQRQVMLPETGQGLPQSLSERAFPAGPLMAPLSLTPGNCWHLADEPGGGDQLQVIRGCFLQIGSILYCCTIQVAGPVPACCRARGGSRSSLARAAGGRMWLQSIAMVTGTSLILSRFLTTAQCNAPRSS